MYHIIWTTIGLWTPLDQRGAWEDLRRFYQNLREAGAEFETQLHKQYPENQQKQAKEILLDIAEQETVESGLLKLSENDRIAEQTQILALSVQDNKIEMLIDVGEKDINQVIGRLKSRSATYLLWSSNRANENRIWSKGFWKARITNEDTIERVKEYICNAKPDKSSDAGRNHV